MGKLIYTRLTGTRLTSFIEWARTEAKQHTVGIGNGADRPPATQLFVYPFNVKMPTGMLAKASALSTAWTAAKEQVNQYVVDVLPSGTAARGVRQYSAARVVHGISRSNKGSAKTSHITGASYLSYGGRSLSVPFGKTTATAAEKEVDNFRLIFARFATASGSLPAGQEVTLLKEKFGERSE